MRCLFLFVFLALPFFGFAQEQPALNVKHISGTVKLLPHKEKVKGNLTVEFQVKRAVDSIFLDARGMKAKILSKKTPSLQLKTTENKIWFLGNFMPGKNYRVSFQYTAQPQQAMYFLGWDNPGSNQIWTQGQGYYTSHWLPSLDDMTDKIEFDLNYNIPQGYRAIASGKLTLRSEKGDRTIWHFDMKHPMSSYLVAVVVGNYAMRQMKINGTPLKFFLEKKDTAYFEPTYRYTEKIFRTLEKKIGVPFPWENHKQVPVRDFLYAGMENTTLTIFSERYVTDSIAFRDRNYVRVNAHELAHQWFGDFVTQAAPEHHWLQEGFATFYTLLAQRQIFGDDFYYHRLLGSFNRLASRSQKGKGESLLKPDASSLTFYKKGAWALVALRNKVGKEDFRKGVQRYLRQNAYGAVTTQEFLQAVEFTSGQDLSDFRQTWLEQKSFPTQQALSILQKGKLTRKLMQLLFVARNKSKKQQRAYFSQKLEPPVNKYVGEMIVNLISSSNPKAVKKLYRKALSSDNLDVRQMVARRLDTIPPGLQAEFESLLEDPSYITQEEALKALWNNFPKKRKQYLTKMKGVQGLINKNVRLLWLRLAINTEGFRPEKNKGFLNELSKYTRAFHPFPLQKNAFLQLLKTGNSAYSEQNYRDLLNAMDHWAWRFRQFSKKTLKRLLQIPEARQEILALKPKLSQGDRRKIEKALKEVQKKKQ